MKHVSTTQRLSSWLSKLEKLSYHEELPSLDRVSQVAHTLGLSAFSCPVITIGGTNGKGSCVATLEAIYLAAGYQVGAYTSPHLLRYNERIKIDGQEVDDNSIVDAFQVIEKARGKTKLNFFEYTTLAALYIFKQTELDILLLEVGIGGRFDAVNIINADVAIVASIDIDHTDRLGHTREQIGFEKAGIFRQQKYAICGDFTPPQSLIDYANKIDTTLLCQGKDFYFNVNNLLSVWEWRGPQVQLHALPIPHLAMQNISTSLMAYCCLAEKLPVSHQALQQAIASVRVNGRFQEVATQPKVIVDVAHNPAAAFMLSQRLKQELKPDCKINAVFSAVHDKDISSMVAHLAEQVATWYVAPLKTP
ncbi:MAG: bifunctional tetrahydrofolate synthase/dihydrofolate synthase, partial [Gammaproteobacteria bacterium]